VEIKSSHVSPFCYFAVFVCCLIHNVPFLITVYVPFYLPHSASNTDVLLVEAYSITIGMLGKFCLFQCRKPRSHLWTWNAQGCSESINYWGCHQTPQWHVRWIRNGTGLRARVR